MKKHPLGKLDQRHLWHPFTQMRDWIKSEPLVIEHGKGALLWDIHGREYIDANSSIWTNLHGHSHPSIAKAIGEQAAKLDHVIFAGCTRAGRSASSSCTRASNLETCCSKRSS